MCNIKNGFLTLRCWPRHASQHKAITVAWAELESLSYVGNSHRLQPLLLHSSVARLLLESLHYFDLWNFARWHSAAPMPEWESWLQLHWFCVWHKLWPRLQLRQRVKLCSWPCVTCTWLNVTCPAPLHVSVSQLAGCFWPGMNWLPSSYPAWICGSVK